MYTLFSMDDPRWKDLANLFYQSTQLKEGDHVLLQANDLEALPLISALCKIAVQKGAASINYAIGMPEFFHFFLKYGNEKQLQFFPEWDLERIKKMDVFMNNQWIRLKRYSRRKNFFAK